MIPLRNACNEKRISREKMENRSNKLAGKSSRRSSSKIKSSRFTLSNAFEQYVDITFICLTKAKAWGISHVHSNAWCITVLCWVESSKGIILEVELADFVWDRNRATLQISRLAIVERNDDRRWFLSFALNYRCV